MTIQSPIVHIKELNKRKVWPFELDKGIRIYTHEICIGELLPKLLSALLGVHDEISRAETELINISNRDTSAIYQTFFDVVHFSIKRKRKHILLTEY